MCTVLLITVQQPICARAKLQYTHVFVVPRIEINLSLAVAVLRCGRAGRTGIQSYARQIWFRLLLFRPFWCAEGELHLMHNAIARIRMRMHCIYYNYVVR